ncbi:unnamed protein product, partial [marine sediment metagenome]
LHRRIGPRYSFTQITLIIAGIGTIILILSL